jgi:hypothetical protein
MRDAIARLEAERRNLWHDAGISLQIAMERGDDQPLNEAALDSAILAAHTSSTKPSPSRLGYLS